MIPEEFTFKAENYEYIPILPNYFSEENLILEEVPTKKHVVPSKVEGAEGILIERNYHHCQVSLFLNTFASLYVNRRKQHRLLTCKHLAIKKNMTAIEASQKMGKFVNFIRE